MYIIFNVDIGNIINKEKILVFRESGASRA